MAPARSDTFRASCRIRVRRDDASPSLLLHATDHQEQYVLVDDILQQFNLAVSSVVLVLVLVMLQRRQRQPRVQTAPAEQIPALFTA